MKTGSLMLDLEGTQLSSDEAKLLEHPLVGGVILFSRNIIDREQVCQLVADMRSCRQDLLIAVDQEGGRVQRLRDGFTALPPMAKLSQLEENTRLIKDWAWLLASEVLACGIDISFTPVLDLDRGICPAIGDRAISADPEQVITLSRRFIDGLHEAGMAVTAKHFPGHGAVNLDSHHAVPEDGRPLAEIVNEDLKPFRDAIGRGVEGMMPAHVIYTDVDSVTAGFSRYWLQDVLRTELGFSGVIFSDDLDMAGAKLAGDYGQRALSAFTAGCDMALVCNNREGALQALAAMERSGMQPLGEPLDLMRARQFSDYTVLTSTPRWQHTQQALAQLMIS